MTRAAGRDLDSPTLARLSSSASPSLAPSFPKAFNAHASTFAPVPPSPPEARNGNKRCCVLRKGATMEKTAPLSPPAQYACDASPPHPAESTSFKTCLGPK